MRIAGFYILSAWLIFSGCRHNLSLKMQRNFVKGPLNEVMYYLGYPDTLNYEKVVLFIRGTGRFPASRDFGMGAEASMFGYSIVYPEKSYIDDPQKYYIHDNRAQRMHDLTIIIDDLLEKGTKDILILADSEGTMLAPGIALKYSQSVKGMVCMAGSVFPFVQDIEYSVKNDIGIFERIESVETFGAIVDSIYADSTSVNKGFLGHPYKFWSSYLRYDPAVDLKKIKAPVLYLNGEKDNVNIRKQKEVIAQLQTAGVNIEQIVYKGVGHNLMEVGKKMAKDILKWAQRNGVIGR